MTLEEETEATTLKRRLSVLYRNLTITIPRSPFFELEDYRDVADRASVIAALTELEETESNQKSKETL